MHRPILIPRVILALTALLAGSACTDGLPTQAPSTLESLSTIAVHSPAHLGVSPQVIPTASLPSYTQLDAAAAEGNQGALNLSIEAAGAIPRFPDEFMHSVAVFGYAWVDGDAGAGVVAVIHPLIGRDSRQNPDGWHTHPVQLTAPASFNFCIVSIGTSQGGIRIQGNTMRVTIAQRQAGLSAEALDVAAAFVVRPDAGCASGLGVEVLAAQAL